MRFPRFLFLAPALAVVALPLACGGEITSGSSTGGSGGTTATTTASGGSGGAVCDPGTVACGAACVDPATDASHCGVCGFACGAAESCCQGACSTDCAVTILSTSPPTGPLSGGSWITVKGTGFAPGARVHLGGSRAPARVVDPETLLLVSPPGLAGKVDVTIDQGATHVVRAQAFEYASYGLDGTWQKIDMSAPRGNWPGIAALQDGRVLISGGVLTSNGSSVEDTADLYDPVAHTLVPTAGKMSAPRWTQASVTLLTGKTLVLGTWFGGFSPPNGPIADLFDPGNTTFTPTAGKPSTEHRWPHAVLLADGRVLIVGYAAGFLEFYDPATNAFSLSPTATDCSGYRPTRLLDGRVLLVKGGNAPVYVFDPENTTIFPGGDGPTAIDGDVYTLPDGRVLYVAGSIPSGDALLPTDVVEIFDPAQMGFQPAPYHLAAARQRTLTTAMAGDGSVLVLGGEVGNQVLNPACANDTFVLTDTVERIDALAGNVTMFDKLPEKNFVMSAVTTRDGSIVAAGGAPCGGGMAYPYFYFLKGMMPIPE